MSKDAFSAPTPLDPAAPTGRAAVPTPLQGLLDPGHALLSRTPQLLGSGQLGLGLPLWNNLQTGALDLSRLPAAAQPPLDETLNESVIEGLFQALCDALPPDLGITVEEAAPGTHSGSVVGRPAVPAVGGSAGARQVVRGVVDAATVQVTLQALSGAPLGDVPADPAQRLSKSVTLGQGEACFLRAQSALWAWRTHRQSLLQLHSAGPPAPRRTVLLEQKLGPLTLLSGCRVTEQYEAARRWGFTLVSLRGQVLRLRENVLVEWRPDDQVVFSCASEQSIALNTLSFLAPVHQAVRRMVVQGYARTMLEMSGEG